MFATLLKSGHVHVARALIITIRFQCIVDRQSRYEHKQITPYVLTTIMPFIENIK